MTPEQAARILRAARDYAEHDSRLDKIMAAMIKEADAIAEETAVPTGMIHVPPHATPDDVARARDLTTATQDRAEKWQQYLDTFPAGTMKDLRDRSRARFPSYVFSDEMADWERSSGRSRFPLYPDGPPPEDPHPSTYLRDNPDPYRGLRSGEGDDGYPTTEPQTFSHGYDKVEQMFTLSEPLNIVSGYSNGPYPGKEMPGVDYTDAHARRRAERMQDPEFREAYEGASHDPRKARVETPAEEDETPQRTVREQLKRITRAVAAGGDVTVTGEGGAGSGSSGATPAVQVGSPGGGGGGSVGWSTASGGNGSVSGPAGGGPYEDFVKGAGVFASVPQPVKYPYAEARSASNGYQTVVVHFGYDAEETAKRFAEFVNTNAASAVEAWCRKSWPEAAAEADAAVTAPQLVVSDDGEHKVEPHAFEEDPDMEHFCKQCGHSRYGAQHVPEAR